MVTSAFTNRKTNIHRLKLTYIYAVLKIKLGHVSQSYIFQLYYPIQVNQDMKAFLFKFAGGANSFENKLQSVMNQNSYLGVCSGKLIKVAKV